MPSPIEKPGDMNVIIGQAHFIKTVEDLHEALVGISPHLRFGIAFCEASSPCLIRHSGNDGTLSLSWPRATRAWKLVRGTLFVVFIR